MGHEDPAPKGSLGEHERKCGDVVEMETDRRSSAFLFSGIRNKDKWQDDEKQNGLGMTGWSSQSTKKIEW
jgi:hypothetical protein